jgi:hypothetical protein
MCVPTPSRARAAPDIPHARHLLCGHQTAGKGCGADYDELLAAAAADCEMVYRLATYPVIDGSASEALH